MNFVFFKERGWKGVVSLVLKGAFFVLPSAVLFVDHYSSALLALGLIGVVLLLRKKDFLHIDRPLMVMGVAFAAMFACSVVQWSITDRPLLEFTGWESSSRYLLFLPFVLLFRKLELTERFTMHAMVWGSVAIGLLAIVEYLSTGQRVEGCRISITFGNIALLFGVMSLLGIGFFKGNRGMMLLSLVGGALGMLASVLSGTRGGWIALPFFLWVVTNYLLSNQLFWKRAAAFILMLVLIAGIGFSLPPVQERVAVTRRHYRQFITGEKTDTSIGLRFAMWKKAWNQFKEHPVIGNGHKSFEFERIAYTKKGKPYVRQTFYHPHNLFLSHMSRGGVLGLSALLFLFFSPLYWFGRNAKRSPLAAACGISVVLGFIMFGITEDILSKGIFISLYVILLAWCVSIVPFVPEEE